MKVCGIIFVTFLLALANSESSTPLEEEGFASSLRDLWDSAYTKMSQYVAAMSDSTGVQYIRSAFNEGLTALATYGQVLTDQIKYLA